MFKSKHEWERRLHTKTLGELTTQGGRCDATLRIFFSGKLSQNWKAAATATKRIISALKWYLVYIFFCFLNGWYNYVIEWWCILVDRPTHSETIWWRHNAWRHSSGPRSRRCRSADGRLLLLILCVRRMRRLDDAFVIWCFQGHPCLLRSMLDTGHAIEHWL